MKTVLAPGAPWPVWKSEEAQPTPKPKPAPKPKAPKKPRSKIARTDAKFIEWAGRNL